MKKILWIILVLIFTILFHIQCSGQGYNVDQMHSRAEVLKTVKYQDLDKREQALLIAKVGEVYYTFNRKRMEVSTLVLYLEEQNPVCEWTGKHELINGKLIKYYITSREFILKLLNV